MHDRLVLNENAGRKPHVNEGGKKVTEVRQDHRCLHKSDYRMLQFIWRDSCKKHCTVVGIRSCWGSSLAGAKNAIGKTL